MNYSARTSVIIFVLIFGVACSNSLQSSRISPANALFAKDIADSEVMGKWARSCALCHVSGVADAPLVGDIDEWAGRLAQGEELILQHVLEGYNSMPPLGYCMSCEEKDFKAMIGFMAGTNQ